VGVESTTRQVAKSVGNILEAFLVLFCYEGKFIMPPEGREKFLEAFFVAKSARFRRPN
jgi:hypothetical protein